MYAALIAVYQPKPTISAPIVAMTARSSDDHGAHGERDRTDPVPARPARVLTLRARARRGQRERRDGERGRDDRELLAHRRCEERCDRRTADPPCRTSRERLRDQKRTQRGPRVRERLLDQHR